MQDDVPRGFGQLKDPTFYDDITILNEKTDKWPFMAVMVVMGNGNIEVIDIAA